MRAQTVFENIEFQRGRDPKQALGIGKKAQIDQWFEKWDPDAKYEVDDDFNIYIKKNLILYDTNVTFLPDDLKIGGSLTLRNTIIA